MHRRLALVGMTIALVLAIIGVGGQQSAKAQGPSTYWLLTGNAGTTPGAHFLGTSDNQALEIKVNNSRAVRIEPNATSPNIIEGFYINNMAPGVAGATIGGGGTSARPNSITDSFGTIGGGVGNRAGRTPGSLVDGSYATVGGGIDNMALHGLTTIGGGLGNQAGGQQATIAGGMENGTNGTAATIGGGQANGALGDGTTVGGGQQNMASRHFATIGGGAGNRASAYMATIGGGGWTGEESGANHVTDDYGTVSGGGNNQAGDDVTSTTTATFASIGGGFSNTASANGTTVSGGASNKASGLYATVGGGNGNTASVNYATVSGGGRTDPAIETTGNRVTDNYGSVGGGGNNQAGDNAGIITDRAFATVAGGKGNTASGLNAAIGGGESSIASAFSATTGGGYRNVASGASATVSGGNTNQATHNYSSVGGGQTNVAVNTHTTVSGGQSNRASGTYATVPGGQSNTALGSYSLAAGRRSKANHTGATVFADSQNFDFASTVNNQLSVRATGGTRIVSGINTTTGAATAGVQLPAGSGAWSTLSDRHAKANIAAVDTRSILEQLATVPIQVWNYKSQDASIIHMGPMAQDFAAAFGVGENDTTISTVDADGVALAAIQGLYQENQELKARLATVEATQSRNVVTTPGLTLSWGIVALGVVSLIALLIVSSISLTLLVLRRRGTSV